MADYQPQKHGRECQVRLLDGSVRLKYPISNLSIKRQVLVSPPLGGFSQLCLTQELSIFNHFPLVVELGGERIPGGINILAISIRTNGWKGDVYLLVVDSDVI